MNNFWKGKKVLITGASGFVGSHLTATLIKLNANITVLNDKKISPKSFLFNNSILDNIHEIIGNVSNSNFIQDIFKSHKFSYCFHLAALPLLEEAGNNPSKTFEVNTKGTWNILESARQNQLDGVIIASTTHVYGSNKLPFIEEYYPRPSGPYETSKACADMIAQAYANYYLLSVTIARCVNIYGPGDQNERIVPNTIKLLINKKNPEIFLDETTRDYMYIDDAINAYITLAEKLRYLEKNNSNIVFNFGTGKHYSNVQIIKKIIKLFGNTNIQPVLLKKRRRLEINKQYVSIEKAEKYLHWQPKYSLDQGLVKTINWYRRNQYKYTI